jgi:hypothetical protein
MGRQVPRKLMPRGFRKEIRSGLDKSLQTLLVPTCRPVLLGAPSGITTDRHPLIVTSESTSGGRQFLFYDEACEAA